MSEIQNTIKTAQTIANWESAKKRRKTWLYLISGFVGLFLAYITGNLVCKVGLFKTKKLFSYAFKEEEKMKPDKRAELPSDYATWFKDIKGSLWYSKIHRKENQESYWTHEAVAKRAAEKAGKNWLGNIGSWLGQQFGASYLTDAQKKEIDNYQWAYNVYVATFGGLIVSWLVFYLVWFALLRWVILPLSWKEPALTEEYSE